MTCVGVVGVVALACELRQLHHSWREYRAGLLAAEAAKAEAAEAAAAAAADLRKRGQHVAKAAAAEARWQAEWREEQVAPRLPRREMGGGSGGTTEPIANPQRTHNEPTANPNL